VSVANSGADATSNATSGSTGAARNDLGILALAGDGGSGGVALPVAGPGGVAVNLGIGLALGGSSIAVGDASGGNGGNVAVLAVPIALSGSSGGTSAQSSSTNTGHTGPAWSGAVSVPVAISGHSGSTGATGPATSNPTAINFAILGFAIVFDI
jgi:hypothetical protein